MYMTKRLRTQGFTIIELMVVLVILVILAALVALTASGVQAKNRNGDRQTDIDSVHSQLETYYAENNSYPTFANLNDATWRAKHLPKLKDDSLTDPKWNKNVKDCVANSQATVSSQPAANCYSYQVTANDGMQCDNVKIACAHYTLTTLLEGGEKYVKSSLN